MSVAVVENESDGLAIPATATVHAMRFHDGVFVECFAMVIVAAIMVVVFDTIDPFVMMQKIC